MDTLPDLYKLTWTVVDSHAHVKQGEGAENVVRVELTHKTQTLIVEAVDEEADYPYPMCARTMPYHGMLLRRWIGSRMPMVLLHGEDSMVIVHSIVPFEPRKRAREE